MPLAHAEIDAALGGGAAADRGRRHRPLPARGAHRARPAAAAARRRCGRAGLERGWPARAGGAPPPSCADARPARRRPIEPTDRSRVIRALELLEMGERAARAAGSAALDRGHAPPDRCWSGLDDGARALYGRIDERVDAMVAAGRGRGGAARRGRRRLAHGAQGARLRGAAGGRRGGDEAAHPPATPSASSPGCASCRACGSST